MGPNGQRIREATPQGHWQILTTLGVMSQRGIEAVMTIASPTDGDVFTAYVQRVLSPKLQAGDVVVFVNLSAHKVIGIRELIEARGAQLLFLPPYSPDLNPIELSSSPGRNSNSTCAPPNRAQPKLWIEPSPKPSKPSPLTTLSPGSDTVAMGYRNLSSALHRR